MPEDWYSPRYTSFAKQFDIFQILFPKRQEQDV